MSLGVELAMASSTGSEGGSEGGTTGGGCCTSCSEAGLLPVSVIVTEEAGVSELDSDPATETTVLPDSVDNSVAGV